MSKPENLIVKPSGFALCFYYMFSFIVQLAAEDRFSIQFS